MDCIIEMTTVPTAQHILLTFMIFYVELSSDKKLMTNVFSLESIYFPEGSGAIAIFHGRIHGPAFPPGAEKLGVLFLSCSCTVSCKFYS